MCPVGGTCSQSTSLDPFLAKICCSALFHPSCTDLPLLLAKESPVLYKGAAGILPGLMFAVSGSALCTTNWIFWGPGESKQGLVGPSNNEMLPRRYKALKS